MHAAAPSPLVEGIGDDTVAGEGGEERTLEVDVVTEAVNEDQARAERDGGSGAPSFGVEGVAVGGGQGAFFCGILDCHAASMD